MVPAPPLEGLEINKPPPLGLLELSQYLHSKAVPNIQLSPNLYVPSRIAIGITCLPKSTV